MFIVSYVDNILLIGNNVSFYNLSKFGYPRISP